MSFSKFRITTIKAFSFCFFGIALACLSGCFSVKPSTTKSGKKFYDTFFVGTDGTQYFIKPLFFYEEGTDETLIVDMTFRYKNEVKDSATINFSLKGDKLYKVIDSIVFSNNEKSITSTKPVLLFNDKNNNLFTSRFTTKVPLVNVKSLFDEASWVINIHQQERVIKFIAYKKSKKAIKLLKLNVFDIM
jgi:hypothetical protein